MSKQKKEQVKLDKILRLIVNENESWISKKKLEGKQIFNESSMSLLEEEGFIIKSKPPITYKITEQGLIFLANRGYLGKLRSDKLYRNSNFFYLLSSPIIAFLSLIVAGFALYISIFGEKQELVQPLNFKNNMEFILPHMTDTVFIYKETIFECGKVGSDTGISKPLK